MKLHHIGIATCSIEKTAAAYSVLGYVVGETVYDPIQNVNICFLTGQQTIELVEPINQDSPVSSILKKNGDACIYHCCYEVENIELTVSELRKSRYLLLFSPCPAVAIQNKRICYLFHKFLGLIELVEK